ncbi:MAG: hypothetical protein IPI35_16685 [Deltaproteobacteria bacterium]|nr:hypothetical protein [Deltaproteobacteria bacterium]
MHPFVRRALIGADSSAAETGTPVDALVSREEAPPWRILLLAGAWGAWRKAGFTPLPPAASPIPALDDPSPALPPGVARLIEEALAGQGAELLPELCQRARDRGRVLPPALLPLALSVTEPERRALLTPILGERGRWLAAQDPSFAWGRSQDADLEELRRRLFEEATDTRLHALRAIRRHDPAMGLSLLKDLWAQETADHRARLLAALDEGLSMADEPFLELCLDDRAPQVGRAAAQRLWRMPHSRLGMRMRGRAEDLLRYKPAGQGRIARLLSGAATLRLVPPDEHGRALARDGVSEPGELGLGPQAWWAAQILACVPPSRWTQRHNLSAEGLLSLLKPEDFAAAEGLSRAALNHQEGSWALPLWRWWRQHEHHPALSRGRAAHWREELLRVMPPAELEALIVELIQAHAAQDTNVLAAALAATPRPWSERLGRLWLMSLKESLTELETRRELPGLLWWELHLHDAALGLPASLLPEAEVRLSDRFVGRRWRLMLIQFQDTIRRRRALHQELP